MHLPPLRVASLCMGICFRFLFRFTFQTVWHSLTSSTVVRVKKKERYIYIYIYIRRGLQASRRVYAGHRSDLLNPPIPSKPGEGLPSTYPSDAASLRIIQGCVKSSHREGLRSNAHKHTYVIHEYVHIYIYVAGSVSLTHGSNKSASLRG